MPRAGAAVAGRPPSASQDHRSAKKGNQDAKKTLTFHVVTSVGQRRPFRVRPTTPDPVTRRLQPMSLLPHEAAIQKGGSVPFARALDRSSRARFWRDI